MGARCALPSKRAAPGCPEAERTAKRNWPASVHAPSPRPPYSTVPFAKLREIFKRWRASLLLLHLPIAPPRRDRPRPSTRGNRASIVTTDLRCLRRRRQSIEASCSCSGQPQCLFRAAFFFGIRAPALRASESPIAIACLRLLTTLPDRPLRNVPRFLSRIARLTFRFAIFRVMAITECSVGGV
jgi:hypothetical protein